MNINDSFMDRFAANITEVFAGKAEIVFHDFTKGYESTIVKIVNSITGRKVGDAPTNLFFKMLKEHPEQLDNQGVYYSELPDGRVMKSISTFMYDDAGKISGAVCLNVDVSDLIQMQKTTRAFIKDYAPGSEAEMFTHSLDELMDYYLNQVEKDMGKPAVDMTKAEKLEALKFLDSKGVLHMSKSSIKLCEFFGFSKYTLYTYLEEIR